VSNRAVRQDARRRAERRAGDRRHRELAVAAERRWFGERRREPRRGGLAARLHRYNG
jgi:hypothetical protein